MKHIAWILSLTLVVALLTGCAKKGVDTGRLESSFRSAEPTLKTDVDNAITALKAGKNAEALAYLNKVASKAKLTADQQQAIKDVIAQITEQMKAATEKTAADLQKSLGK